MRGTAEFRARWLGPAKLRQSRPHISPRNKYWLSAVSIIAVSVLARSSPGLRFGPPPQFEELLVGGRGSEHFVALRNSGLAPLLIRDLGLIGEGAGDFVSTAKDCISAALPPGRSCIVGLTFAPHREGRRNAELTVLSENGVLPARLILTGVASARSDFRVDPSPIEFGDQAVGTVSEWHQTKITSVAGEALQISSPRIIDDTAEEFDSGNNTCAGSLPPGANCFVEVRFHPRVAGQRSAWLELHAGSGRTSHEIRLTGRGTVADLFVDPELVPFPPTRIGQWSVMVPVLVRSSGTLGVQIGTVTLGGEAPGDFHVDKGSCESMMLRPNATCQIKVQFQPTTVGLRTATVSLMDDSPDGPHISQLQGTGTNELRPSAQIYAQTYSFGNQPINTTSKPVTVFVISRGATNLTIGAVAISGEPSQEFQLKTDCSRRTLRPKEHCEIEVYFHPTAVRDFRARIPVPHE